MSLGVPWLAFFPEIVVLATALAVFLLDVLGVRRTELLGGLTVGGLSVALLAVVADLRWGPLASFASVPEYVVNAASIEPSDLFAFTPLGLVFQGIFLLAALLVALGSLSRPSAEKGAPVFFGLLLVATLGMLLAALSADLIFLLLSIEVVGISTYLLVAYTRKDSRGLEAAMKFYIVGALSTAISFFGASLLYGSFHSTSLVAIAGQFNGASTPNLALAGYALLIAGLGFKATIVPFHAWAVDVYDGAPTDVTAFLAGGSKKVGIFAFFLLFFGPLTLLSAHSGLGVLAPYRAYDFAPYLRIALGVLAVLTMTVGNVLALLQKEMKRMLAYSSISQAGYMLIGIAVGTSPALAGATFQAFSHVFMKVGAFLVVAAVAGLGVGPLIDDWRGLGTRRPYLGVAFALMLLSLAGIPLTVGFFSKFVLFSAAVQAQGWFVALAVAGLLNSAVSVFYYARVLKVMFMDAGPAEETDAEASSTLAFGGLGYGRTAAIALAAGAIVVLGLDPQPVLQGIQSATDHFLVTGA